MSTATATTKSGISLASAAQSDTVLVEGNIYFPPSSLSSEAKFTTTKTHSSCPWKGVASYYDVSIDGTTLKDAAWFYPEPRKGRAEELGIKDFVAFYKTKVDVKVE